MVISTPKFNILTNKWSVRLKNFIPSHIWLFWDQIGHFAPEMVISSHIWSFRGKISHFDSNIFIPSHFSSFRDKIGHFDGEMIISLTFDHSETKLVISTQKCSFRRRNVHFVINKSFRQKIFIPSHIWSFQDQIGHFDAEIVILSHRWSFWDKISHFDSKIFIPLHIWSIGII